MTRIEITTYDTPEPRKVVLHREYDDYIAVSYVVDWTMRRWVMIPRATVTRMTKVAK